MNQVIFNLQRGKLGRVTSQGRRPVGYYGETSTWQFFCEDIADAYATALENVDRNSATWTVKIGDRGSPPVVALANGDFTPLDTTITLSQIFEELDAADHAMAQLRWKYNQTPVRGYFRIGMTASIVFPAQPNLTPDVDTPAVYTLHAPKTAAISVLASEAEIEDAIQAMLTEFAGGHLLSEDSFGTVIWAPGGTTEVPGMYFPNLAAAVYPGHRAVQALTSSVRVLAQEESWTAAQIDVRPFPVSVYISPLGTGFLGQAQNGYLNISAMTIEDADTETPTILGAYGRFASVPFTDAGFGTLLGSLKERRLWMELQLDGETKCEGEILLKKRMA